jgi:Uncharacterized conserved protein
MKFQLDAPGNVNLVRGYGPGQLRIGETTHTTGVILTATTVIGPWRPATAEDIGADDLAPLLDLEPEIVLLGTGQRQHFPDPEVLRALYARRIGVEVMDTSAACRTFNLLVAEGRPVAAALIV